MAVQQVTCRAGLPVFLSVARVDGRIQLFRDGVLVMSKHRGSKLPAHFELTRGPIYTPVYDNNEGGAASFYVALAQYDGTSWNILDYEVDLDLGEGPQVHELPPFTLTDDMGDSIF